MARRQITTIFGTSMIDLLVGAMSMMALLWVFSATNNGNKGYGDVEYPSYYVSVNSYGSPHISMRFRISDADNYYCEFEGRTDGKGFGLDQECDFSENIIFSENRVEYINKDLENSYVAVQWDFSSGFKSGFTFDISKQQKGEVQFVLDASACKQNDPHYIQISGYSDGEIIDHFLIHQTKDFYLTGQPWNSRSTLYSREKNDDGTTTIRDDERWIVSFIDGLKRSQRVPDIFIFEERSANKFGTPIKLKFLDDGSFEYDVSGFIRGNNQSDIEAFAEHVENF